MGGATVTNREALEVDPAGRLRRVAGGALLPADGSALSAAFIQLAPSGPSPNDLTIPTGMYPWWSNPDQVPHAVVFANGLCSFTLAPGESQGRSNEYWQVGRYAYTVDGTIQASVAFRALPPDTVTLTARSHSLRRGAHVRLYGVLGVNVCCLPLVFVRTHVIVLARHDRHHPFQRIATILVRVRRGSDGEFHWQLRLRPGSTTIYIAKRNYQPEGERGWKTAWSRPFKVFVRR